MATVYTPITMDPNTVEAGSTICKVDMANTSLLMAVSMRVIFGEAKDKEMGNILGLIRAITQDNGNAIVSKVEASVVGVTEGCMLGIGKTIRYTAKVCTLGVMDAATRESIH